MTDKDKLSPLLRAYKAGYIDFDYSLNYILDIYRDSKRFNNMSFKLGLGAGIVIGMLSLWVAIKY